MYQLLETIKLENGIIINQGYHQRRIDDSAKKLNQNKFELAEIIIPQEYKFGIYKMRIIYSEKVEKVELQKYQIKKIERLKFIENDKITYNFKFLNRIDIENLLVQKGNCDDIIIAKNGEITDTSYANLIFIKNGEYFTPINPLLNGTKRDYFIDEKILNPILIRPKDIDRFEYCKIINAMINIDDSPIIQNIRF